MARKSRNRKKSSKASLVTAPAGPSGWARLSERAQHLVCLGFLLLLSFSFFAPIHFGDGALAGGDTVKWRSMAEAQFAYEEATGEQALWNPNAFGGMPGYLISYANPIPQINDLPGLLRRVIWPSSHFIFLLVGVYLLVFFLTRDKLGGLLAACAYGLTTYLSIILAVGHNTKFVALCFAPWLVLAFAYALRKPKLLSGLLFAVALAANLQAGHVQITYYVAFLLGIWWIVEAVGAFRHGRLQPFGAATGWLALGSVLGLLMVAFPYLTYAEYKAFSIRGASTGGAAGGLDLSYAMAWSQGPGELLTLLIADAFGGGAPLYWGPKPFTEGPNYVGGVVLLLATLTLWRVRRNVVYAFGIAALLMTLFALGEYFPLLNEPMFRFFPLFDAFRVPETWLSAVAFALAVLAGVGLCYAARAEESPEAEQAKTKAVLIAAGVAVGLVALLFVMKGVFFEFERPGEGLMIAQQVVAQNPGISAEDPRVLETVDRALAQFKGDREAAFTSDALRTLLFLLLAGAVLFAYRRRWLPAWAMQGALILLVVVDLWGVDRRHLNADALQPAGQAQTLIPSYDFDRFILARRDEAGGPGAFRVLSLEAGNPITNARPSYYYESLGGYHGAKLRLYQDFAEHIFVDPQTGLPDENALDLLNARYVVAPGTLPGYEPVYRDEQTGMLVLENQDVLPRAFFVGETEVIEAPEATWARLQSDAFDPRRTAILPEAIAFETTPLDSSSTATVELESYTPHEIVWQVETDAPRLLVVSEIYYPAGWTAEIDGEAAPIVRADYLLRAVPVSAGEHTLVMRFAPSSHRLSVWITGLSTLFVYGAIVVLLGLAWRRKEEPVGGEHAV